MTLATIKSAIKGLPEEERTALIDWLLSRDREDWDKEITQDFSPGGQGMMSLEKVDAAIDRGDFKPSP
ncbi:MAG: hypothetical protein LAO07_17840 [Acidobacteriia bacterium]|nr:hypothetical protein [Terriglobia bacterium]